MERDQASKFVNDLLRLMVSRNGSDLFLTAEDFERFHCTLLDQDSDGANGCEACTGLPACGSDCQACLSTGALSTILEDERGPIGPCRLEVRTGDFPADAPACERHLGADQTIPAKPPEAAVRQRMPSVSSIRRTSSSARSISRRSWTSTSTSSEKDFASS